mgnify:CR=1 FL=1
MVQLAEHFLAQACEDYGLPGHELSPNARDALRAYSWPGNVRELANAMERVALLTDVRTVTAEALGLASRSGAPSTPPSSWGTASVRACSTRSRPPTGISRAPRRAWASRATRCATAWTSRVSSPAGDPLAASVGAPASAVPPAPRGRRPRPSAFAGSRVA